MTVFKTHPSGSAPSRGFLTRIPLAAFAQNDGAVFSPRAFGTSLQDRRQIDQILSPPFSLVSTEFWESLDNSQLRRSLGMSREDGRSSYEILEAAIEKINKRSRSSKVSLDVQGAYVPSLAVTL